MNHVGKKVPLKLPGPAGLSCMSELVMVTVCRSRLSLKFHQ